MRAEDIIRVVDAMAPPELMEPWDCAGLQAGDPSRQIGGVLTALDVTLDVVREALALGCEMIIAHHPILFGGTKTLREDRPEGALAAALLRGGITLYTVHTALDRAPGGLNDEMADRLGLSDVRGEDYVRVGAWAGGDCAALLEHVRSVLDVPGARLYGAPDRQAGIVGVTSGAGMGYAPLALEQGAQVFITGDVRHHEALDLLALGMNVIDAGHRGTEALAPALLGRGLQNALGGVECPLRVCQSQVNPYYHSERGRNHGQT